MEDPYGRTVVSGLLHAIIICVSERLDLTPKGVQEVHDFVAHELKKKM